jgi:uncharacterized protein YbjT (DUF2867 family)
MSPMLVFGATGNVGSAAVAELDRRGVPVRAFVRDPSRAPDVEKAVGDLDDPGSVKAALEGVDRVLLAASTDPRQVERETGVIDAAAAAGVSLIVKVSDLGAQAGSPVPGSDWNGRVQEHLARSGVPHVVLRCAYLMSNLFGAADGVRNAGTLFAPAGDGRVAMIDPRDVGAVAAVVLAGSGHDGRTYQLTGPDAVSFAEVAAAIGAATGRPVAYADLPPDAARAALTEAGLPDWLVTQLGLVHELVRQGVMAGTTDVVAALTGRPARTVADFARANAAIFAPGLP